jgi:hypothetical protein
MTIQILFKGRIRAEILKILSGYSFRLRGSAPRIYIIMPWIWGDKVTLEIDEEVIKEDENWFRDVYEISSINLPYALLLLKLDFGAEINIVTRPPDYEAYKERAPEIRKFLDFLDEIGCKIFLNNKFHSKLLLSNDLAILGSMNLSKSALDPFYGQEEIGVSIDDLSNLKLLENYAVGLIEQSKPDSYTYDAERWPWQRPCPIQAKITRGWLYERIVVSYFGKFFYREFAVRGTIRIGDSFSEFLRLDLLKDKANSSSYDLANDVGRNLDAFYSKAILQYLKPTRHINDEDMYSLLYTDLGYQGKIDVDKVVDFLEKRLARRHVPEVLPMTCPIPSTSAG